MVWLGAANYAETFCLQRELARLVSEGSVRETVLLLEHPHVYTLGRRGKRDHILATAEELNFLDVEVHEVDRGGEVTYHGPGQLVGYPIVDLRSIGGPLKFVCALQEAIVSSLARYDISGVCGEKPTGVWVGNAKIGAIGLRVSRGVSSHGFAVNVSTDLSYFDRIVPCGMPGVDITSMAREGVHTTVRDMSHIVADALGDSLGRPVEWTEPADLTRQAKPFI